MRSETFIGNPHPIPDSYWVVPGKLLAGEYPGAPDDLEAQRKVGGALLEAGVKLFVDLTEAGEYNLRPYWPHAQNIATQRDLQVEHCRLAIRDMDTPEPAQMRLILDTIDQALGCGKIVYVHCYGGIGRTGTVAGCYLVRWGRTGTQALDEITLRRKGTPDGWKRSPETEAQRNMVLAWRETQPT